MARVVFFDLGQVAQLVEHMTENHGVGSSILPLAMNNSLHAAGVAHGS
jgi:hypothetical protein